MSELAMSIPLGPFSDAKVICVLVPYRKAIINSVIKRTPVEGIILSLVTIQR